MSTFTAPRTPASRRGDVLLDRMAHELFFPRRLVRIAAIRRDRNGSARLRQENVGVQAGHHRRRAHGVPLLRLGQLAALGRRDRAHDFPVRIQRLSRSLATLRASAPARSAWSSFSSVSILSTKPSSTETACASSSKSLLSRRALRATTTQ